MWPQSGDAAAGSKPGRHGVPGPVHVTVDPSPSCHTARTGVAVAVTDNPATAAVADCGAHDPAVTDNHVGNPTS